MGPLREKIVKNLGMRSEPILELRLKEYSDFLNKGGIIAPGETIIAGVRGGGIAFITTLPEVLDKKCVRLGISYKIGDVIIVVDILTKVLTDTAVDGQRPTGTVDFVRSSVDKLLHRTVLMSNIILPEFVEGRTRSNLIPAALREGDLRINGMNVYRLQSVDLDVLRERESELFSIAE